MIVLIDVENCVSVSVSVIVTVALGDSVTVETRVEN